MLLNVRQRISGISFLLSTPEEVVCTSSQLLDVQTRLQIKEELVLQQADMLRNLEKVVN